jgi:hypothetical protein
LVSGENGEKVKLVDFGERHIKQALPDETVSPNAKSYFAPEQFDRSRQPNLRSDIYAAGTILYQMLTGVVPSGNPVSPETLRRDIPQGLAQVINKSIAQAPNNRYQSISEFIHALDSINWQEPPAYQQTAAPPAVSASIATADAAPLPTQAPVFAPKATETASVIVEMPEIEKRPSLKVVAAVIFFIAASGFGIWYFFLKGKSPETTAPPTVQITIQVTPPDAVVSSDGKHVGGTPPVLTVAADADLHTISAKADGFEPVERDVRFDQSKTVKLDLMEIIQPDEPKDTAAGPTAAVAATPSNTDGNPTDTQAAEPAAAQANTKSKLSEVPKEPKPQNKHAENPYGTSGEKLHKSKKTTPDKKAKPPTPVAPSAKPPVKNVDGFRTTNPFE